MPSLSLEIELTTGFNHIRPKMVRKYNLGAIVQATSYSRMFEVIFWPYFGAFVS